MFEMTIWLYLYIDFNVELTLNRMIVALLPPYAITFLPGGSFFVAFDLQLYSVFDDDLQGICSCSMAMLTTTLAKINYSPREDKSFSSRE